MNIAIVTTWFERGAAYVSKQIADTLINKGEKVFIYSRGGEFSEILKAPWNQYKVERDTTPRLPMPTGMNRQQYKTFLIKNSIDLVIFNEQRYWAPLLWTHEVGLPCAAYIDYYTENTIELFHAYDLLICNTKRHYSVFKNHRFCTYIPWGTDTSTFVPDARYPTANRFTFFHSAGMNPYRKGSDLLIRALEQLSRQRDDFNALIHTQTSLEDFFPDLRKKIDTLKSRGLLLVENRTVPAPGLYHRGNVYVYPSRLDGIGLTIPEALSCGLPVIATDSPPMSEFISSTHGHVVKIGATSKRRDNYYWPETTCDIDDLTSKMAEYCDNNNRIEEQSYMARQHATTNLDWNKNSQNLANLLAQTKRNGDITSMYQKLAMADNKTVRHYETLHRIYNAAYGLAFKLKRFLK